MPEQDGISRLGDDTSRPVFTVGPAKHEDRRAFNPRCKFCGALIDWGEVWDPSKQTNILLPFKPHTLELHTYSCPAGRDFYKPKKVWVNPQAAKDYGLVMQQEFERASAELKAMTAEKIRLEEQLQSSHGSTVQQELASNAKEIKSLRNSLGDLFTAIKSLQNYIRANLQPSDGGPLMSPRTNGAPLPEDQSADAYQEPHVTAPKDEHTATVLLLQQARPLIMAELEKGAYVKDVAAKYAASGVTAALIEFWLGTGPAPGLLGMHSGDKEPPKQPTPAPVVKNLATGTLAEVCAKIDALALSPGRKGLTVERKREILKSWVAVGRKKTLADFKTGNLTISDALEEAKALGLTLESVAPGAGKGRIFSIAEENAILDAINSRGKEPIPAVARRLGVSAVKAYRVAMDAGLPTRTRQIRVQSEALARKKPGEHRSPRFVSEEAKSKVRALLREGKLRQNAIAEKCGVTTKWISSFVAKEFPKSATRYRRRGK